MQLLSTHPLPCAARSHGGQGIHRHEVEALAEVLLAVKHDETTGTGGGRRGPITCFGHHEPI